MTTAKTRNTSSTCPYAITPPTVDTVHVLKYTHRTFGHFSRWMGLCKPHTDTHTHTHSHKRTSVSPACHYTSLRFIEHNCDSIQLIRDTQTYTETSSSQPCVPPFGHIFCNNNYNSKLDTPHSAFHLSYVGGWGSRRNKHPQFGERLQSLRPTVDPRRSSGSGKK